VGFYVGHKLFSHTTAVGNGNEHCLDCSVFMFGVRHSEHLNAYLGILYPVPFPRCLARGTCYLVPGTWHQAPENLFGMSENLFGVFERLFVLHEHCLG
jgi:hypothetical protein